jgi:hypothetical protein
MRPPIIRRFFLLVVGAMLLLPLPPTSAGTGGAAAPALARSIQRLSPELVRATLQAQGTLVRRGPGLTVERVRVPVSLRTTDAVPETVFRVSVAGRFPPRALPYTVVAGGRGVGFGIPTANSRAVRAITTDAAVLTARVTARYAGRPVGKTSGTSPRLEVPTAPDTIPNPGTPGPYEVTRATYNLGDRVFQPSDIGAKVELAGDVHYPTGLPDGPYPLVLFMHGNHSSCYKGNRSDYRWPCKPGWKPLPNYAGYDYIASKLASYGYIVASVSANGVNVLGNYVDDTGMRQRGEVLEKHIDLWNTWSSTGGDPFGSTFVGKIDLTQIGTMGHSRGGEGVVWNNIVDQERATPYGIDAVLALAPVDFTRQTIAEVPFAVMLPYCDGDVSDLQGVHFFDDSRYLVPGDTAPKDTVTVFGANHNFFNTVWSPSFGYPGAFDDGGWTSCSDRLTAAQERKVGAAYIVGFFRRYLGGETAIDPMWTGAAAPAGVAPTAVSYLAPDTPDRRLDVDRFTDPTSLATGETGGAVTPSTIGIYGWCDDRGVTPCIPGDFTYNDIHVSFDWWFGTDAPGLQQGVFGWSTHDATVRFDLPGVDVSSLDAVQFRTAVNPGYGANRRGRFQDLTVALIDGNGDEATAIASDLGTNVLLYPVSRRGAGHVILNQLRFPLDAFNGVDPTDIQAIELRFDRSTSGVINVADLNFSAGAS